MEKLSEAQVQAQLSAHPEWSETGDAIQRTYLFPSFAAATAFVNKVADAAERADHHPDLLWRYNKITVMLSTHDAGGITVKDFELASACDAVFAGMSA